MLHVPVDKGTAEKPVTASGHHQLQVGWEKPSTPTRKQLAQVCHRVSGLAWYNDSGLWLEGKKEVDTATFKAKLMIDEAMIERWCSNISRLAAIQGIRNYSTAKDADVELKRRTLGIIHDFLLGNKPSSQET